ncbi:MAG: glycosyltransferase [Pseudomonadota bacterium]
MAGGGIQRQRLNLAAALVARGRNVELVVGRLEGELIDQVPSDVRVQGLGSASRTKARLAALRASPRALSVTIPVFIFSRKPASAFRHLVALTDYLRVRKPHALLCGSPNQNLMVCLARRAAHLNCVLVLSEHNDLSNGHKLNVGGRGRAVRRMSRNLYADADALVAVSDGVAGDMARRLGMDRARIHIIHQPAIGDNVDELASEPLDHPWFRPDEPPVLLSAGRFADRKDFPTLIKAFARVRRLRSCRLVILGNVFAPDEDRIRRQAYQELADSLGCGEAFDMPGYDNNPYRYMARAGVFVLSSQHEGMPNVLAEAMAVGCPVVSTDCPSGPREILADGRFGALVPVGDDEAMAKAIIETLDTPLDRQTLHERAQILSADRSARRYEALLLPEA